MQRIAFAQQGSKVWRIGYLSSGVGASLDELRKGLRELGYQEGKNFFIELRFAGGDFSRLPALAADLVNRKVDVIVVSGTPPAIAVKRATSTIPVVMAVVGDPVGSGLVSSLARPGGNITGLSLANTDLPAKWFELATTASPGSKIGVLANPRQQTNQLYAKKIQDVGKQLGARIPVAHASTGSELEAAFDFLNRERVTTVIVLPNGLFAVNAAQIAQSAIKRRMASIATTRSYAERGALLSYGQNYDAFERKAATYVDKILKGAKPGDLPIEQPVILELTINVATAKQIGLPISKDLLLRADRVIK